MSSFTIPGEGVDSTQSQLAEWEQAVIDLFLNAAHSAGLPKSLGQIYGLLFCSDEALAMDEIMNLLSISKGSASQGLRALRQLGAVKPQFARGDRKERFVAEIRLRKLVAGFLKEQAEPHMEKGVVRLQNLRDILLVESDESSKNRGKRREIILSSWHKQMVRILPWVKMIVGKSDRLPKKKSE